MELSSAELAQLLDNVLGIEDHAFQIDHTDLVAKAAEAILLLRANREVHQSKNRDQEEKESSSAKQYPKKYSGTRLIGHGRVKCSRMNSAISFQPSAIGCSSKLGC